MLSSRAARRTLPTMRASFFRLAALAGDSKISTSESRCATTAFPHPFIQDEGITTPSLVYFTAFIGNASNIRRQYTMVLRLCSQQSAILRAARLSFVASFSEGSIGTVPAKPLLSASPAA
ncbi:MAG: hypothetical protein DYH03_17900 [Nitrospira sp. NTP1]|nr:hypothetical protein [Nitrospira sp. NTP1]